MLTPDQVRDAWACGEIGYRLREVQKVIKAEWEQAKKVSQKFFIEGNRRLGKSELILILIIGFLKQQSVPSKGGFYAPVKDGLEDYIRPIIDHVFLDCPAKLRPTLTSKLTLSVPRAGGGRDTVIFRGSNNRQHRVRRGNDLAIAGVDELRDVDEADKLIDSVVFPSLFTKTGFLLIGSTPPDTEDHPAWAIRTEADRGGWLSHHDILDCGRLDPQEFTPEKIALWKKETKDPSAWEREYMARMVKDPTKTAIPEWSKSYVQAVEHDQYFPYYHKYAALDSGVVDKTAVLHGYYDFKKAALIVEDEFVLSGPDVVSSRIAKEIKAREESLGYQPTHDRKSDEYKALAPHEKVYRRVADNNNLVLVNDMNSDHQLDFFPTDKISLDAMINKVREWAKDGRILVHPRCVETAGCLDNGIWDKNREKLAKSKVYGHFDALMALVYLVRNVDTHTNPIPKYFGQTWATHPGVPVNSNEPQTAAYVVARMLQKPTDRDQARNGFVKGNVG